MSDETIQELVKLLRSVVNDSNNFRDKLLQVEEQVVATRQRVEQLIAGFPNADPPAHRIFHEECHQRMEDRRESARGLRNKMTEFVAGAGVTGIAIAVWEWVKTHTGH